MRKLRELDAHGSRTLRQIIIFYKFFCNICKRHNVTSRNIITKNTGSQSTLSVFVTESSNMKLENIKVHNEISAAYV